MKISQQGNVLLFLAGDGSPCLTVLTELDGDRLRMGISGQITPETQQGLLRELRAAASIQKDLDIDLTEVTELPREVRKMLLHIWLRLRTKYDRQVRIVGMSGQLEQTSREHEMLLLLHTMSLKGVNVDG